MVETRPSYAELQSRLSVAENTLQAIRRGEVDALIVQTDQGEQLFTLQGADALYRVLLEEMPLGVGSLDASGTILFANPHLGRMLQTPVPRLVGRKIAEFLPPDRQADAGTGLTHSSPGESPDLSELRNAAGELFPVALQLRRLPGGGEASSCLIVGDLTDMQRELADAYRRYEQIVVTSRLQSEFVANMSHEIRTPLNGVIGLTEMIADTSLADERPDYIAALRTSGEALMAVVNRILDFSRLDAGKLELSPEELHTTVLVEQTMQGLAVAAAQKGVSLNSWIEPDVPSRVRADPARLGEALTNLLSNAIKFTDRGGEVRLRLSRTEEDPALRFAVSDTGIGIDPRLHEQIFDPFVQADASMTRRYGGTGLGLTIVKQLADLMGGRIEVDSTPGEGSTFCLQIPCEHTDEMGEPQLHPDGGHTTPPAGSAVPVLLAEDDPINQLVARHLLERVGCEVEVASNGLQAVELSRANNYHVIFMDCQMPDMDGYEATRAIRLQEGSMTHTPIVAITAHAMTGDREQCLAAGMDDYLSKPLKLDELDRVLHRLAVLPRVG
ncbi:MAG: ATP-binding protein [Solirubrobacteraceae bacterium]|jgi:PAS domain S-box-containing protein